MLEKVPDLKTIQPDLEHLLDQFPLTPESSLSIANPF
jgi:hypothetical protein